MSATDNNKIILFDGVCNLCNGFVVYIIKRDKNNRFRFAALQSEAGEKLLNKFNIDRVNTDSIILVEGDNYYERSSAALHIAKNLSGAFPLLYGFMIIPKFIRDGIYNWIARNRYKWFGKKESCMIPTKELQSKFL